MKCGCFTVNFFEFVLLFSLHVLNYRYIGCFKVKVSIVIIIMPTLWLWDGVDKSRMME